MLILSSFLFSIIFLRTILTNDNNKYRVVVNHVLNLTTTNDYYTMNIITITPKDTADTTLFIGLTRIMITMPNITNIVTNDPTGSVSKRDVWGFLDSGLVIELALSIQNATFTITEFIGMNTYTVNFPVILTTDGIIDTTQQNLYFLSRKDKLTHIYYYYIPDYSYTIAIRQRNTIPFIEPFELQSGSKTNIALYNVSDFSLPLEFTSFHIKFS